MIFLQFSPVILPKGRLLLMKVDYIGLGRRIRARRKALGMTQERLAELSGLCDTYVGQIERAIRIPSLSTLVAICYALEISPNELMCDSLPEGRFASADTPLKLRQVPCVLHNTLTNWLCTDLPDQSMLGETPADLSKLPPIGFVTLSEDVLPPC